MLRPVLMFVVHRGCSRTPPCCASAARPRLVLLLGLLVLLAVLALLPRAARPMGTSPAPPQLVAEALFLCDPLPPGGRDLSLSLAGAPDDSGALALEPHVQLALGLGDRAGLTADAVVDAGSDRGLRSPDLALKVLLRDPAGGGIGVGGRRTCSRCPAAPRRRSGWA